MAREVRPPKLPTLALALLPAQSLRVSVFNLPYHNILCVCVHDFPLKFWKVVNYYRYKPSDDCSN